MRVVVGGVGTEETGVGGDLYEDDEMDGGCKEFEVVGDGMDFIIL